MYDPELFEICDGNHVMLICEDEDARLDAAAHFINEGLKSDQLCIYASVHAFDNESKLNVSTLSSRITDFKSNSKDGNIQIIDFKPFYDSVTKSNLSPFVLLRQKLESTLRDRTANGKGSKIIVFADAACCLTEDKEFQKSMDLEMWWQRTHDEWIINDNKVTVICPHAAHVLREEREVKWHIADDHDVMVSLNSHLEDRLAQKTINGGNLRILIADSEPDLVTLYSDYLTIFGHDVSIVTDGSKCLSLFKKREYDVIILDTHLRDNTTASELAREITRIEPHQKLIVTSTHPSNYLSDSLRNIGLREYDILQKPFHLSQLLNIITRSTNN